MGDIHCMYEGKKKAVGQVIRKVCPLITTCGILITGKKQSLADEWNNFRSSALI